jgi:hypothetical protein
MPIISLTQEAIDRGRFPEIGWSPAKLNRVTENKAAKGESVNWYFEFIMTGGPESKSDNAGRYQTFLVNSAGLSNGIKNAVTSFKTMVGSLLGLRSDEVGADDFDTDKLVGKTCWIKIEVSTIDGKLIYQITDFSADADIPF